MSRATELADAITPSKDNVPELGDLLSAAAELRRLERVNAELVEALEICVEFIEDAHIIEGQWHWEPVQKARAALTSATKEQQK
jgi:hypothetical protein